MAELFLQNGYSVIGCEPSEDMRNKAESLLKDYGDKFKSVDACAEHTKVETDSVGLILIANALHFLDNEKTLKELKRILKHNGRIAVLYNILAFAASLHDINHNYSLMLYHATTNFIRRR